jgi:O-antigen biosynthesis protein
VHARFSVLTAVFNPPPDALRECMASVRRQTSGDWQHVVVNDGSDEATTRLLRSLRHQRMVLIDGERRGIVGAAQRALAAATGELVALLDHDDVLHRDALARAAAHLDAHPDHGAVYTDHDIIRADGRRTEPFLKPDFSPERLRGQNYITHLVVARRSLVEAVGGFRNGFDGAQDHDLLLRLSERTHIGHVAEVLYHWRQAPDSVASNAANKTYAYEAGRRAVQDHCRRVGLDADVRDGAELGCYRVHRRIGLSAHVFIRATGRAGVVWGAQRVFADAAAQGLRDCGWPVQVVRDVPDHVDADIAVIVDEAVEPVGGDAVNALAALLAQHDVAMVGGRLLGGDGRIRSGGIVGDPPADALRGWAGGHPGPGRMMLVEREVAAVRGAVCAVRSADLGRVAEHLNGERSITADARLGATLRASGRRVLWTPHSSWYWFDESYDAAAALGRPDPYYPSTLVQGRGDWLEQPGLAGAPPYYLDGGGTKRFA